MASVRLKQLAMEVQAALPSAEEAMQHAEKWLSCRDQHEDLVAAVDEVLDTLRGELSIEGSAKADHSRSEAQRHLLDAGVKAAIFLFSGRFQTSRDEPEPAPSFGRVLVAVGPEGVPVGLQVFNISKRARSEGLPESVVEKGIAVQGNVLLTQDAFEQLVAWLRTEVLAGRIALPYHPHGADNQ